VLRAFFELNVAFYDATSHYLQIDGGGLVVAFLDSGSDLKIGLEGVDKVVDAMSNMVARA
jgi:hypothetical protein